MLRSISHLESLYQKFSFKERKQHKKCTRLPLNSKGCTQDRRWVRKDQVNWLNMERKRDYRIQSSSHMQECREKEIGKRNWGS